MSLRKAVLIVAGVAAVAWFLRPGPRLFGLHVNEVVLERPPIVVAGPTGSVIPQEIHIKDPVNIARFVPAVHARKYKPSGCAHVDNMEFITDLGIISASVCPAHLDFTNMLPAYCEMPDGLYGLISAAWDSVESAREPAHTAAHRDGPNSSR